MEASLEGHLEQLVRRHAELREALARSGLGGAEFAKLSKEYSDLGPIVEGIDMLRFGADGLIDDFTVFVRPFSAVTALRDSIGAQLAAEGR